MNYDVMARVYRIERRARAWVQYTLLNVVLTAVLTVVLVVWFDTGALGLLIGNFTGTAIVYLVLIVARRETVGIRRFETPVLRELLVFSVPLMPANIALWALNLADRMQVQQIASHQALGSYSAAARVSMAMAMVMGAFQTAWAPYAHQVRGTEGDEKAKITYARVLTYWSVVMGFGLVGISLIAPPYMNATFPASTHDAIPVVPLLAIGIVLYGCYLIVNIGVTVSRKNRMTPVICTVAAVLNIGLNFWFIPQWGIVGAGITTVIGYAVLLWLGWWNAQRSYPVRYNWPRIARVALVVTAYLAASEWVIPQSGVVWLLVRVGIALTFPLALLAAGAITRPELRRGREIVRRRGWRFWSRQGATVDSVDELV
jgi:O-antigen/teichoic acid export membrane protein